MNVTGARFSIVPPHSPIGDIDLVCPACRSKALFTLPYGYIRDLKDVDSSLRGVRYGGGFAVERFPDAFPWRDPDNPWEHGNGKDNWGVIACPACGRRRKHLLDWPNDAFYKADFSVGLLWAYSRKHLVQIQQFVAGDRTGRSGYLMNLVPKEFILVRNRERVLKAIEAMLARPEVVRTTA